MSEFSPDSVMTEAYGLLAEGQVALWLELYAAFPEETRAEFPDVVHQMLELSETTPTASLLAPLYGEEANSSVRLHFIRSLAAEARIESAQVLQLWRGLAPTRAERQAIRRALEQLDRRGIALSAGAQKAFETAISARMSSADGMGSYRIVIEVRMDRSAIYLAFAINVDAGLREAERMGADAAEYLARFGEEYGLADAEISPALAVLTVRDAVRRSRILGRELPEGWEDTAAWLDKIPSASALPAVSLSPPLEAIDDAQGSSDPRDPAAPEAASLRDDPAATRLTTRQLALRREFETWFLPPVAALRRDADAYLADARTRGSGSHASRSGLLRIVSEYVLRAEYRERLVAMLEHQVRLYTLCGDSGAARAAQRAIDEVELGQVARGFLRVFAERSLECLSDELARTDPLPPDERRPAWVDALRPEEAPTRRDVVRADFALLLDHVLATELDLVPLARRPSEPQLIGAISACADAVLRQLEQRAETAATSRTIFTQQDARRLSAEFARTLQAHTPLARKFAAPIARVLADRARSFANQACGQYCVHACPAALDRPGQDLYDIQGHPARLGPRAENGDARALRDAIQNQLRRATTICKALGIANDALLDALASWEARIADAYAASALDSAAGSVPLAPTTLDWARLQAEAAAALREALRSALERLPRLAPSSDPATRTAWERFSKVYSALPVELVSRMVARSERPSDVLSLLFSASDAPGEETGVSEVAGAVQQLWNATPRVELAGKTPNQMEERGS